jgi:Spy/CpxP family protein refolding chaperone
MRSNRLVFTISAFVLANALNAQSNETPSPEEKARHLTDKMVEHLQLTDDQSEKVYQLNLEGARELDPYVKAMREAQRALEDARKRVVESKTAELKALLTPGQVAEFEKRKADRDQRRAERQGRCKHQQHKRAGNVQD